MDDLPLGYNLFSPHIFPLHSFLGSGEDTRERERERESSFRHESLWEMMTVVVVVVVKIDK